MKTAGPNPKRQDYVDALIGMSAETGHKKIAGNPIFLHKVSASKNFVIGCKILGMTTGGNY